MKPLGFAAVLAAAVLAAPSSAAASSDPVARASAVCADHPNQASAQRAKDTRDADGDGIYCEALSCPCLKPGAAPAPKPKPERKAKPRKRAQVIQARVTSVVDGDTIKVRTSGALRRNYTVRLLGVDTPETRKPGRGVECGGVAATSNMRRLTMLAPADTDGDGYLDADRGPYALPGERNGQRVELRTDPTQDTFDRYKRLLAYVTTKPGGGLDGQDVGEVQLLNGLAQNYLLSRPYRRLERYRRAVTAAQQAAEAGSPLGVLPP